MNSDASPVVMRRRLTAELRRLRALKGHTQEEVASALEWRVSRHIRTSDCATINEPLYTGASGRFLIKLVINLLSVLILAALSRISKAPSFALRIIAAFLKYGHRQEPASNCSPLKGQINQGMLASLA
jgi:hypothetical protein